MIPGRLLFRKTENDLDDFIRLFLIRRLRLSGLPRYRLCFGPFLYISALAVSATCSLSFALHGDFGLSFDLFVV